MKIVQINATCGVGSTGRIVKDLHESLLQNSHESYVLYAIECSREYFADKNIIKIGNVFDYKLHGLLWRIFNNQGWNSRFSTLITCKRIAKIKPDIVHLHNLHGNYIHIGILLKQLKKQNIPVVITMHDCWFFTGNCTHFKANGNCQQWKNNICKKCPAFSREGARARVSKQYLKKKKMFAELPVLGVVSVSDWVATCVRDSFLGEATVCKRIYNWIDTSLFCVRNKNEKIREKYNVPNNKFLILGVTQSWTDNKGIEEFMALANRFKDIATIVLVGEHKGLVSAKNIIFISYMQNQKDLAELYSEADVFVNPSRMETFGLVTAEAMSCGTPVVAYNNTAMAELITGENGILVQDGNCEEMMNAVEKILLDSCNINSEQCRNKAIEMFDKENLLKEHLMFYEEISRKKGSIES